MPAVRLQDIVDALEMQFDEIPSFLDLDTGQVEAVSLELLHAQRRPTTTRRAGSASGMAEAGLENRQAERFYGSREKAAHRV
jgi:hypothetical protein